MPRSARRQRRPIGRAPATVLAAGLAAAGPAFAQTPPPAPVLHGRAAGQHFLVERKAPDAVIRFVGLHLKNAISPPHKSEIVLHFTGAAEPGLFEQLESALPGWVAMSYTGADSAVVRARRSVAFMTRQAPSGFELRMVAQGRPADGAQLRGAAGSDGTFEASAIQRGNPREAFALRGADYARSTGAAVALRTQPFAATEGLRTAILEPHRGPYLEASAAWRNPEDGTLVESHGTAEYPITEHLKLIGSVHDLYVDASAVRRLDGSVAPMNGHATSGGGGLAYTFRGPFGPAEVRGEALWSKAGWGGETAYGEPMAGGRIGASVTYRAPDEDTSEAAADHAYRTGAELAIAHRIAEGVWGQAVLRVTRYGVPGDDTIAKTIGGRASLRYLADLGGGIWGGLAYEYDAEYVLSHHSYRGLSPTPFIPLDIHDYEVHAMSASASTELAQDLWADLFGGYAIDRYGPDGYFAGGDLRYAFAPGWALTLGGGHSQVSARQGERGPQMTAGLNLVFDWDAAQTGHPARPLSRAYFGF